MRCKITLDTAALQNNYRLFQELVGLQTRVVPVVKSNAYGHGLAQVYTALAPIQPPWFAVNYLEEAETLRRLGHRQAIMVVGPLRADQLAWAKRLEADVFLVEPRLLDAWLDLEIVDRPRAHIKFDTGMSRQGFLPEQVAWLLSKLRGRSERLIGLCSHFANVEDVLEQSYALQQLHSFEGIVASFRAAGLDLMPHISASSSALLMQASRMALVRIGISAYGLWPSRTTQLSFLQASGSLVDLRPVLRWETEVAIVKQVRAGQFIGYGCTYKALRDMTIAVLPVGYFEGYPRLCSNRAHVLIHGQRCPVVGRICMNMMMVDISHLGPITVETPVTLIGQDGDEHIDASQIGEWADTIHYEILTHLNPSIPREAL